MNFDVQKALQDAWDFIWKHKREQLAKGEGFRNHSSYLTATDLAAQIKQFAVEQVEGKPRGHYGLAWSGVCGSSVRLSFNALEAARVWLLSQSRAGIIQAHNFGRGHISGMRFRPLDVNVSEPETVTIKRNNEQRSNPKPRPCHYNAEGYWRTALCQQERMAGRFRMNRSKAWTTADKTKVTCKACLNKL